MRKMLMQTSYVFILSSLDAINEAIMSGKMIERIMAKLKNWLSNASIDLLTEYHKHISEEWVDTGHRAEHLADHVDDWQVGEAVEQINREEHYCRIRMRSRRIRRISIIPLNLDWISNLKTRHSLYSLSSNTWCESAQMWIVYMKYE